MAASSMASCATTSSRACIEAERAQRRPQTQRRQERPHRADRRARRGRGRLGGDRGPERDADQGELAVAQARLVRVELADLGQDDRERQAVGQSPARPDRVAQRVDQPDTGATLLADPGQVRGDQHLRAGLEVRAVRDGRVAASPPRSG